MPTKRATIYEVADRAGVSHQTVSRYLRHNGGLKPATLTRVEAAIEELNYRPNRIARSMRTRRTGRLAILLPGAIQFLPLRLLTAAATVAHEAGYAVDLVALEGDAATRSERALELTDSGEFEGILALASWGPGAGESSTAVVTVADYDESMRGIGALADARACGDVVRHLADLGHRSLLHLAGDLRFTSARNRRRTFLDTVAELGLQRTGHRRRLAGRDRVPGGARAAGRHRHHRDRRGQRQGRDGRHQGLPAPRVGGARTTSACSAGTTRSWVATRPRPCPRSPSTSSARGLRRCGGCSLSFAARSRRSRRRAPCTP